jgi:hypothetical protein
MWCELAASDQAENEAEQDGQSGERLVSPTVPEPDTIPAQRICKCP